MYICIYIYLYFYLIYIHLPHDIPQCLLVTCSLLHLHWFMLPWNTFLSLNPAKQQQPPVVWGTLFRQTFKVLEILVIILVHELHDLVIQKNIRKCVDILTLLMKNDLSMTVPQAKIQRWPGFKWLLILNVNKHNKDSLAIYWDQLKMCYSNFIVEFI